MLARHEKIVAEINTQRQTNNEKSQELEAEKIKTNKPKRTPRYSQPLAYTGKGGAFSATGVLAKKQSQNESSRKIEEKIA